MERRHRLPTKLEAYQRQCFDPITGEYTGFHCPFEAHACPIKKADGMEILDALKKIGGYIELHHHNGSRFSATGTTYAEQVVAMCSDCHTLLHADDPSASRLKRK